MNRNRWYLVVFIACWGAVLYGMYMPQPSTGMSEHGLDKLVHLVALAAMTLTARLTFPRLPAVGFYSGMLLLAFALEYFQPIVQPSRQFGLADLAADWAGVVLGWVLWRWWAGPMGVQSGKW